MATDAGPSPLFDGIAVWLMAQGLSDVGLPETIRGFGQRLVAGGLPVHRIGIGGMLLHPVFGALDIVWRAQNDQLTDDVVPRAKLNSPEFRSSPYFQAATDDLALQRFRLEQPTLDMEYPIFEELRAAGVTDYILFYRNYGRRDVGLWAGLPIGIEGALGSFSTRRLGGFSDLEVAYLQALVTPLALVIKAKTDRELTRTLLDTYLGKLSGDQVRNGLIERGDGQPIECVIWYSDLRSSTALAEKLSMADYLAMLDAYFDCTAGAVLDHGGEVLKFIGDAVMAIFPFEDERRPAVDMCRAAVNTTREALARAERLNADRRQRGEQAFAFGVSLHVGEVLYGNVGTERRLDFTVIGPAANEAARLEQLSKTLGTPVIASATFAKLRPDDLIDVGRHKVVGVKDPLAAHTLKELVP